MKWLCICLFLLSLAFGEAWAGEQKQIELVDGSVISGEILSLKEGFYTIRSVSLGTLRVEESRVSVIRSLSGGDVQQSGAQSELDTLIKIMLNDKAVMDLIHSLQNDPEFQKILNDPDIMAAVSRGDLTDLTKNPKFMQLLNHPKVLEIKEKLGD